MCKTAMISKMQCKDSWSKKQSTGYISHNMSSKGERATSGCEEDRAIGSVGRQETDAATLMTSTHQQCRVMSIQTGLRCCRVGSCLDQHQSAHQHHHHPSPNNAGDSPLGVCVMHGTWLASVQTGQSRGRGKHAPRKGVLSAKTASTSTAIESVLPAMDLWMRISVVCT